MAKKQKRDSPGRPPALIDWKVVDQYLQAQCDGAAIARFIGIHPQTLYDRCVEDRGEEYNISNFTEYAALKKAEGKDLLKAAQFQKAIKGDATMQIWLGKNLLQQKDKGEMDINLPAAINVNVTSEKNKKKLDEFLNDAEPK